MRAVFEWNIGTRVLELGKRTLIMGIVNVTPDSFSDGGMYLDRDKAVERVFQLLEQGADIVDIGGESTRPGSHVLASQEASPSVPTGGTTPKVAVTEKEVTEKEELERILPVIVAVKQRNPAALLSVDTYKANVARAAVEAGADIVNDVSGFRWDPQMKKTLAQIKCGAILTHMRGRPEEWASLPAPGDTLMLVKRELRDWVDAAMMAGIKRERIALDPGFGFGKKLEQNYPLLKRMDELVQLRYPLVVGVSRKSFIGRALARNGKDAPVSDRLYGTLAAETAAILKGAHIIRTHDVAACADAAHMADRI